ncbi:uncharacterized protein [Nicotiana sylvestris]|uniref:uncharacterized protein n=1 Tax=Nicotiana sylvestris TaxID=4096 RepID=UPI00388C8631
MDPVRCTKFFESTIFDAILESHETTQHVVPSAVHAATAQYEDSRKSLELRYGVEIPLDAMQAACEILERISPKVGVVQLLEEAATKLRKDFDCDSEQKDLDFYEFLFNRAFVESREMMKEKDPSLSDMLPCASDKFSASCCTRHLISPSFLSIVSYMSYHFITQLSQVKKELEEVKGALEAFTNRRPAPLRGQGQHHNTVVRHKYLVHLAHLLRILYGAQEQGNWDGFTKAIRDLHGDFSALSETIDIRFAQHLTVTPRIVAEVASSITGVPRNFFPAPFQLPVELLVQRLSRKLVGLDNQLRAIINAMSIHKLGSRPLYSFLLLSPSGHGKTALAEALAKEMFDNRIVEYKVAGLTENDFIVRLFSCPFLVVDESEGASDSTVRLISSCVLVFDNVDKANTALYDIFLQILESGSYVDACGRQIVFSNTLILFTSRVEFPRCGCAREVWETSFEPPFKGLLKSVGGVQQPWWCDCNFHERLADVRFSVDKNLIMAYSNCILWEAALL